MAAKKKTAPSDPLLHTFRKGVCAAFSPKGKIIALGGSDSVTICDLATGQELRRCEKLDTNVTKVAFSANGKRIATASMNGKVSVCDTATGKRLLRLNSEPSDTAGLCFAPRTGELLHAARFEDCINVWNTRTGKKIRELHNSDGHWAAIKVFRFDCSGDSLAVASKGELDTCVSVLNWATGAVIRHFQTLDHITDVAFSRDEKLIAVAARDTFVIHDAHTGRKLRQGPAEDWQCWKMSFSPDGRFLVFVGKDKLSFWKSNGSKLAHELKMRAGFEGMDVVFSFDNKYLAVPAYKKTYVWDYQKVLASFLS